MTYYPLNPYKEARVPDLKFVAKTNCIVVIAAVDAHIPLLKETLDEPFATSGPIAHPPRH